MMRYVKDQAGVLGLSLVLLSGCGSSVTPEIGAAGQPAGAYAFAGAESSAVQAIWDSPHALHRGSAV